LGALPKTRHLLVPVLVLLAFGAAPAKAQLGGYVAGGSAACSDSRSADQAASPATPWCTLGRAVAAAPSGSTVLVRGGSYPELNVAGDRHRSGMLTLKAHPGESVSLDGIDIGTSSLLRVEGFRVTSPSDLRAGAERIEIVGNDFAGHRLWVTDTVNVLIEGNHIHDIPASASGKIGIRDLRGIGTVIRGNRIENLAEDPIQVTEVTGGLIESNTLLNAHPVNGEHTDCIQILGADGLTIRGNYIRDMEHCLMFTDFVAVNVTIENNVVSAIESTGMKASGTGNPGLRVINNTFFDSGNGVDLRTGHPGGVVSNNIFEKVSDLDEQPVAEHNLITAPTAGTNYGKRAILANPRFVNPGAGDFELAAGSPAIDAGTSVGAPAIDQRGRPRHDEPDVANTGTGASPWVDIGALEHGVPSHVFFQPGRDGAGSRRRRCGRARSRSARVPARMRMRRVRRNGIAIRLARRRGRRVVRAVVARRSKPVYRTTKRVGRGARRVRLDARRLRRALRPGRYTVTVRMGPSRRRLGRPTCLAFRVVRGRRR
jgi:Right handed beta helix region